MASSMFDLPLPFRPVIALKRLSKSNISVLWPYDLKPSSTILFMYILYERRNTKHLKIPTYMNHWYLNCLKTIYLFINNSTDSTFDLLK